MSKFVAWFAVVAPLLLWVVATGVLILTAPIWMSLPTCCVIDDAALLTWLSVLPLTYLFAVLPAAAAALLLFHLYRWSRRYTASALFLGALLGSIGVLAAALHFGLHLWPVNSPLALLGLIIAATIFGILFLATVLSALAARRFSQAIS